MRTKTDCLIGSGNVYEDLGFFDAEEMQAKAVIASFIMSVIEKKNWTQAEAAKILGISQPKISLLSRGQFSGFSMGKLIKLVSNLNQDIDIVIKKRSSARKGKGHIHVIHASI